MKEQGIAANSNVKRMALNAVITRADGTVENLGTVCYEHENDLIMHVYENPHDKDIVAQIFEKRRDRWIKINGLYLKTAFICKNWVQQYRTLKESIKGLFSNDYIVSKIDLNRSLISDLESLDQFKPAPTEEHKP